MTYKRKRDCNTYMRQYYKDHKEACKKCVDRLREERKAFVHSLKIKCIYCDVADPDMLEFHHRNPNEKESTTPWCLLSENRILGEVSKCDVVCANHHAKIHACWRMEEET